MDIVHIMGRKRGTRNRATAIPFLVGAIVLPACPQPVGSPPTSATEVEMTSTSGGGTTEEDPTTGSTTLDIPTTTTDATTLDTSIDDTTTTTSESTDGSTTSTGDDTTSTSTTTTAEACGDGVIDPGEECDDGMENDDAGACTKSCAKATCGDHLVHAGVEACDLGAGNQDGVYGGCTEACTLGPHCGDSTLDLPYEQCDPADPDMVDVADCELCSWAGKIVFASSVSYPGDLGGLSGADGKCQTLAEQAGFIGEGRAFRAWLSSSTKDAASRMTHSQVPYILLNGKIIADHWADLTDGMLSHRIDRDEKNTVIPGTAWAWTATTAQGKLADLVNNCKDWTSTVDENKKQLKGARGRTDHADSEWTLAPQDAAYCVFSHRIYCVEQ